MQLKSEIPNCPMCNLRPRYVDKGRVQPFCSRACHRTFSENNGCCLQCNEDRFVDETGKKHLFCSTTCAAKNLDLLMLPRSNHTEEAASLRLHVTPIKVPKPLELLPFSAEVHLESKQDAMPLSVVDNNLGTKQEASSLPLVKSSLDTKPKASSLPVVKSSLDKKPEALFPQPVSSPNSTPLIDEASLLLPIAKMNNAQIVNFLNSKGDFVALYAPMFEKNCIDGEIFSELSDLDLIDLGVLSTLARKMILKFRDEHLQPPKLVSSPKQAVSIPPPVLEKEKIIPGVGPIVIPIAKASAMASSVLSNSLFRDPVDNPAGDVSSCMKTPSNSSVLQ